jgi:RNA polymerase sigma-70 factor (ECF subfamily)
MGNSQNINTNLEPSRWVETYGDYLYSYAYYRVSSVEIAKDLVQETFLSALKSKDNFKGKSSEKTWLISILKRKIVDHYRKQSRVKEDSSEDKGSPFIKEGLKEGQWQGERVPLNWEQEGIDAMDRKEFYKILDYCMSLLPEKWASVFRLKIFEELSSPKICKEMGITSSNFWVIMHRARLRLRECFEHKWMK